MKNIFFSLLIATTIFSCSENKRLIKKAEVATGRMDYSKAVSYYDQVLEKDNNSYRANVGKGMVLSEFMEQYEAAIPYLEKALVLSPKKDTLMKINYNLGKGYHRAGNYNKALYYYSRVTNTDRDFDPYYNKRITDCHYALSHTDVASQKEQNIKNAGETINSSYPEYAAVKAGDQLFFTARKKDDEKEKINGWDGKYFESMYVSSQKNEQFSAPERYTIPDLKEDSKFQKHNEAVISVFDNGKKMYVYRDGKIYEGDINAASEASKMDKEINFSRFQNHASVSGDGKVLFFTSDSKYGKGGTDIYRTTKNENGKWSEPELLDSTVVNTSFNEESPYYSTDGTLYFSSDGLPGYGGYDVYKTSYKDGKWTTPENLGQPINSPGDDVFFVLNDNTTEGYYSSNRTGGYGDMDIYHVHYAISGSTECNPNLASINYAIGTSENPEYYISIKIPEAYEQKALSYQWNINDSLVAIKSAQFQHKFTKPGDYKISAKVSINCDSCPSLVSFCTEKTITIKQQNDMPNPVFTNLMNKEEINNDTPLANNLSVNNFNINPIYFDYDQFTLKAEAISILDKNIEIMKKNKNIVIDIAGYTDSRGSSSYNEQLAAKRNRSVQKYLLDKGISANRISGTYALGETKLTSCPDNVICDEQAHQKNRRVEMNVNRYQPNKILSSIQK